MLIDGRGCVVGHSEALAYIRPTCQDLIMRTLYGVLTLVSWYAPNREADLPRRRLAPTPCWVHPRDMCACTRPAAGRIAQRARSVPAPRVVRRSTAAPNNVRKTRSSSDDLLSLLARQLLAVRSIVWRSVMSVSDSFIEFCGCTTPLCGRCGTAAELTAGDPSLVQLASS